MVMENLVVTKHSNMLPKNKIDQANFKKKLFKIDDKSRDIFQNTSIKRNVMKKRTETQLNKLGSNQPVEEYTQRLKELQRVIVPKKSETAHMSIRNVAKVDNFDGLTIIEPKKSQRLAQLRKYGIDIDQVAF